MMMATRVPMSAAMAMTTPMASPAAMMVVLVRVMATGGAAAAGEVPLAASSVAYLQFR
jgi:hypothetical protein